GRGLPGGAPDRGTRSRPAGRRPSRDPDARPYGGPPGAALPRQVPFHGRPPVVESGRCPAGRVAPLQLALLERAAPLDGAAPRPFVRVGPPGPWSSPPCGGGDPAPGAPRPGRTDEVASVSGRGSIPPLPRPGASSGTARRDARRSARLSWDRRGRRGPPGEG